MIKTLENAYIMIDLKNRYLAVLPLILLSLLFARGWADPKITPETTTSTDNKKSASGKTTPTKSSFDTLKVSIKGLTNKEQSTNAKNALSIYAFHKKEAPQELRLQWLHEQAEDEIKTALAPFGLYRATIQSNLENKEGVWIATYTVTTNEAIPLKEVDFSIMGEGRRKLIFKRILSRSKLQKDEALNHEAYEETKGKLTDAALERGYFDSKFTKHAVNVDLDRYESSVELAMDTGPRYYFDTVNFEKNYFHPDFLARFVLFNEHTQYADKTLIDFQSDLNASDYFEEIAITPTVDGKRKKVPLDITVKPRKQRIFSAGVGYGTDIGFRTSGVANWRYVNQWGHKLANEALLAQKQQRLLVKYTVPGKYPVDSHYDFYGQYDHEDTKYKYFSTALVGMASVRTKNNLTQKYSLDYRYDRFTDITGKKQRVQLIVPSLFWEWKSREKVRFGRSGFKVSVQFRGASKTIGSDINFAQAHIKANYFFPMGKNNRLILRGELGHTFISRKDLNKLAPGLRFYAGGDYSVRGYRLDAIGPVGTRGKDDIIGGKKLAIASAEWEHRFTKEWSGAAFIDAGDAFNGNRPKWKVGAGVGVRWYSPIGSVRFDVAHGFDKQGDAFRFHLNIGADL